MPEATAATPRPFPPSVQSVHLRVMSLREELSTATGFLVDQGTQRFLVTNWHVVSGRNAVTQELLSGTGASPDALEVRHLEALQDGSGLAEFVTTRVPIRDEDQMPLWFEHPRFGSRVDVAAIPSQELAGAANPTYDPWAPHTVELGVGDDLKIVGYPFGVSTEGFAVWTHGFIASEYEMDHDGLPMFLVDARTRPGQSGSPAIWFRTGGYLDKYGGLTMPGMHGEPPTPGQPVVPGRRPDQPNYTQEFLGIYSGRINVDSDLGRVWRPSAVQSVITGGRVGTAL